MTNTHVLTLTSHPPAGGHSSPTSSLIDSFHSSLMDIHRSSPPTFQVTTASASQQENGNIQRQHIQSYLQHSRRPSLEPLSTHQRHPPSQQSHMNTTSSITPQQTTSNTNELQHDYSIAEWAGGTTKSKMTSLTPSTKNWKDVDRSIKQMDQLYDATFYSWLKSEDNVLVTAMYLHRIANDYSLDRVVNAVKWLVSDWRWESTSILVRHITAGWCDEEGDKRRAQLLRHLTQTWATQYTAILITAILTAPPYATASNIRRERFIRAFTDGWGFSKLSEFFMHLQGQANINYKVKCLMLQEAARRERKKLSAKLDRRRGRHNQRTENNTSLSLLSPATFNTTEAKLQPADELSSYTSGQMNYHHSITSITRHQHPHHSQHDHHHVSGLDFDECTSERPSSCASQSNTSSLPLRSAETSHQNQNQNPQQQQQQQPQQQRYHQHHRRISSSDMMEVKRQRFSSAFDDDSTDIDFQQNDVQQHNNNVSFVLSSSNSGASSSSTQRTNKSSTTSTITATAPPASKENTKRSLPTATASSSTQSQSSINTAIILHNDDHHHPLAENGDLPEMGLGTAVRGGCSAGSGTTLHPTSSIASATMSTHHHHQQHQHHHQRQQSRTSNTTSRPVSNDIDHQDPGTSVTGITSVIGMATPSTTTTTTTTTTASKDDNGMIGGRIVNNDIDDY